MKRILLYLILFLSANYAYSQNLLNNGSFEFGSNGAGFNVSGSGYTELTAPFSGTTTPGQFAQTTDPALINTTFTAGTDHSGSGQMLVFDGSTNATGQPLFWEAGNTAGGTTCGLIAGNQYVFSYWIKSVSNLVTNPATQADIRLSISNATGVTLAVGSSTVAPLPAVGWQQVTYTFTATGTCIDLGLWNNNTSAIGNDFAVDDFSLIPSASIHGTTRVCLNDPSPNITFIANVGTGPYTFTYNINGGPVQTVVSPLLSNSATVPAPTSPAGIFDYNLISVSYGAGPTVVPQTGVATVTVRPLPNVTMTGSATILPGGSGVITFTGGVNTPAAGATVTFTASSVDIVPPQTLTIVLGANGNATYSIPYITATTTYNLVSVTSVAPDLCTRNFTAAPPVVFTINSFTCALPLVEVNIGAPSSPSCNPGDCIKLKANYSNIGSTASYVVNSIPFCVSFPTTGGTEITAPGDDTWSPVVNLPFKFSFYGTCYDKVIVGTNGVISFDISDANLFCPWAFGTPIPNAGFPIKNAIYGVYQDTDRRSPPVVNLSVQNVNYFVLDTGPNAAPNRVFVANFNELPTYDCGTGAGLQTSQIVIHETTNIIEVFVGRRAPCNSWQNGVGVIGVQNNAGTIATVPPGRNTGSWSTTNEGWRFIPRYQSPTPVEISWLENGNPIPGSIGQNPLTVCPTAPSTDYTAVVKYTDCVVSQVTKMITHTVYPPLPVNNPVKVYTCDTAAPYSAIIDQDSHILGSASPANYIISYYENEQNAKSGTSNNITSLSPFVFSGPLPKTIYVRIEDLNTNACYNVRSFVIEGPTGTISYPSASYCNSITAAQAITNTNVLPTGGTYSAVSVPPGLTLSINATTGAITPSTSQIGTYTVSYSYPSPLNTCSPITTTVDIVSCGCVVNVSAASTTACVNGTFTPITFTTAGATAGSITSGTLPAGVTGNFSGGTFTISATGTLTTAVTANISVTLTTPTGNCTGTATIVINPQPDAGTNGTAANVCDSSIAAIDLFGLINGEQPGGTWTRTTGTGGTFNAAAGTFTPASGATSSTFTYTLTGIAPCTNDTSLATVNIVAQPNAGTSEPAATVCDNSTTAINLFNLINGEQTGGAWTRTTGTGGTFNAAAGTFTPTGATSSTFTYTLTGIAPCVNSTSLATININPQPNAGTAGTPANVCDSSTTAINLFNLINGEQTGGTWSQTTGTGGTFNAAAGTFTPASGATTSTFTYTLVGTAPCSSATSLATVNIIAQPDAGTAGTPADVCDSSTAAINLFDLINGEQTGGTWTRTTGTGGTFSAAAGTFTPASGATTSTFTYTLTGTAPCVNDSSVATVNITAQPDAGTAGTPATVCESSIAAINLFNLINGEQPGGTWTRTTGTGGTFNAAAGTFTPASGATTSTFTYTVAGTAPCTSATSLATVNIIAQPDAGIAGTPAGVCDSSTAAINLFDLINGEQTGGTWTRTTGTGGTFNAAAGTFTPALGATTSTFTYTLTGTAPCINDSSIATVNITAQPDAGTAGTPATVCESSIAAINLFNLINGEQPGGTWTRTTGTGGTFNAVAGTFTPALGATTSTFTYTLTNPLCANSTSLATVNINAQPDAGTAGTPANVCDSSTAAINLFDLINGEQTGGIWTRTTGTGGTFSAAAGTFTPAAGATTSTFTYEIVGAAPCINDSSVATVNISAQANAGTAGTPATVCDSSTTAINLFDLINGEQTGGTWTRATGTGGTFNAAAGTFTPASGATTSTFTYEIIGTAPCPNVSSVGTVNINPQPDAGTAGTPSNVCETSSTAINLFDLINGEQTGGTWVRTSGTGGNFNAAAGTFTPAVGAVSSTFTYTIVGTAPCVNVTSIASVNITAQPEAGTSATPANVCETSTTAIDLFDLINGEQTGGTWVRTTGTGGTFNAAAGTFTPAVGATNSTFTYTLTGTAPCINDSSVATVNINTQPDAGTNGTPVTICETNVAAINLFNLINGEQSGGTWRRTTGTGGTFNAGAATFTPAIGATNSTFTYEIVGVAPCVNRNSVGTVNILPQPDAGTAGTPANVCDSSTAAINLFDLINGEQTGGTWVRTTGTGGTFNAAAATYTPASGATTSTFTYTISGVAPCINDSSVATVNITAQPVAGTNGLPITVCDSNTAAIDLYSLINGEQTGGTWTRTTGTGGTFNAAAGTFAPASGATSSTFTYTKVGVAPCVNVTSVATININPQPNAGTSAAPAVVCETSTISVNLFNLINGEQTGGTWTRTTGTGGTFNATAGTFIPAVGATSSTFTYTLTGVAPCINSSSVASVTVNPSATIVLTSGVKDQEICINTAYTTTVYTIGNGATGASITSGGLPTGMNGIFNAGAGTFTISGSPSQAGTFNFVISASGGCPSVPINASVKVNPRVSILLDSAAGTPFQTKCVGDAITEIAYEVLNGATGATVTGLPPGMTTSYNPVTHLFTINGSGNLAGTYNYTVSTQGGCTPAATLTGTITIPVSASIALNSPAGTGNQSICINEILQEISYHVGNGATGASITSGSVPTGITVAFDAVSGDLKFNGTVAEAGVFNYTVETTGGCGKATITGRITVNPLPVINLEQDGYICVDTAGNPLPGVTYTLHTGLNPTQHTFVWTDATGTVLPQTGSNYIADEPGTYKVEATNTLTGCIGTGSATIVPSLPPDKAVAVTSSYFAEDAVITVFVTPPGVYLFQLDGGALQDSNSFHNVDSGNHTVTVIDKFRCGTVEANVKIIDFPRFFTPNGDGYNDFWNIPDLDELGTKIYIFDRYGKLLKEISTMGEGWDGSFNSRPMPGTDYWFQVFYKEDGVEKQFKSHFSLKR